MVHDRYKQVLSLLQSSEEDFNKFYNKQVQAAGTRVRSAMQRLKELAQEIRKEVQDMKNSAAASKAPKGKK